MDSPDPAPDLMTKPETAARLRVSTRTLNRRMKDGSGPPETRIGGRVFFRAQTVDEFLDARARLTDRLMGDAQAMWAGADDAQQHGIVQQMQANTEALATRLEAVETAAFLIRAELQGLVNIAHGSGLFPVTDRVLAVLANPRAGCATP